MFCGSSGPVTKEHIFRRSWKKTLEVNEGLTELPFFERRFSRYDVEDNSIKYTKLEDLFSVIVKRVCDNCNNQWMNDLDTAVEPWVFNPMDDETRCDPVTFRRWAIKVALLRSYYENPNLIEPSDPPTLFAGDEIPDWHVFIGHTALPEHRHALCGVGPVLQEPLGRPFGITQVSWTLGHSLVTALRVHGTDEISTNCFKNFRQYNGVRRGAVREVKPSSATEMPTVRLLPALSQDQIQELVWLFTPHPSSPFAKEVRTANEWLKTLPGFEKPKLT
ncbi:hypothetical protein A5761_02900 [Mycolicibacterium setense]|nr:hypothetical protein A5761_02900 [Mycolicibacterium setense]